MHGAPQQQTYSVHSGGPTQPSYPFTWESRTEWTQCLSWRSGLIPGGKENDKARQARSSSHGFCRECVAPDSAKRQPAPFNEERTSIFLKKSAPISATHCSSLEKYTFTGSSWNYLIGNTIGRKRKCTILGTIIQRCRIKDCNSGKRSHLRSSPMTLCQETAFTE